MSSQNNKKFKQSFRSAYGDGAGEGSTGGSSHQGRLSSQSNQSNRQQQFQNVFQGGTSLAPVDQGWGPRASTREPTSRKQVNKVFEITRRSWQREVVEASKVDWQAEGATKDQGSPVVCLITKKDHGRSEDAADQFDLLARNHPFTKFVAVRAEDCIENKYSAKSLPAIVVYRDGKPISAEELGDMNAKEIEIWLSIVGAIQFDLSVYKPQELREEEPIASSSRSANNSRQPSPDYHQVSETVISSHQNPLKRGREEDHSVVSSKLPSPASFGATSRQTPLTLPSPPLKDDRDPKRVKESDDSDSISQKRAESEVVKFQETYELLSQVGEGTYGKVYKAKSNETGVFVALKRIRMEGEKEGFPVTSMREIKLLQTLKHENVVMLHEMMISKGAVYMVFEYMDHDLTGVLSQPQYVFSPANLKSFSYQMISGLSHLHQKGVLHRDMKGSNILINGQGELKLADFGLARFYHKRRKGNYTNRVITLWYRPLELLLGATEYGPEVDMWSAGCIILEMYTRKAVFQGNDDIHQLQIIMETCGTPLESDWPGLTQLPWYELLKKPTDPLPSRLKEMYSQYNLSPSALDLVKGLLTYDPEKRLLANDALQHTYFTKEDPPMKKPSHLAEIGGEFHELEAKRDRAKRRAREKEGLAPQ